MTLHGTSVPAPQAPPLRVTQMILLALAVGIVAFAAVVVFLRLASEMPVDAKSTRILTIAVVLVAAMELPVYFLLRKAFHERARAAREESLQLLKEGRVPPALHVFAVIGAALAEGVGLLGIVTVLLGGAWAVMAAPFLAVVAIVAQMPTLQRLEHVIRG